MEWAAAGAVGVLQGGTEAGAHGLGGGAERAMASNKVGETMALRPPSLREKGEAAPGCRGEGQHARQAGHADRFDRDGSLSVARIRMLHDGLPSIDQESSPFRQNPSLCVIVDQPRPLPGRPPRRQAALIQGHSGAECMDLGHLAHPGGIAY